MSKDGGTAFPQIETDNDYDPNAEERFAHTYSYGGMSLRDYFATKLPVSDDMLSTALASILMDGTNPPSFNAGAIQWASWWAEAEARYRYLKADAMLKARGE